MRTCHNWEVACDGLASHSGGSFVSTNLARNKIKTLKCTIHDKTRIRPYLASLFRYKGDELLKKGDKYDVIHEGKGSHLKIKKTQLTDGGRYTCKAKNVIAAVETSGTVTIHSK
jgi:hypothetical protein